jgi:AcrR family transcriptional regulator
VSQNEQIRPITSPTAPTPRTSPDRRVRRTQRQILDATVELMKTRGVEGLTMDAVAEAADVSRSTLYRHWPHLRDLLADSVQHLGEQVVSGTDVTIEGDTFEQCVMTKALVVGRALRVEGWRALIATLEAAAGSNADAAAAYDRWVAMTRSGVTQYVRGCEVAAGLDPAWVSDLVLGPIYLKAMLHEPMTDEQITAHVTRTLTVVGEGRPARA